MKVSSTLLKAMVITAALGVSTVGCKTKPKGDKTQIEKSSHPRHSPDYCPACGMG